MVKAKFLLILFLILGSFSATEIFAQTGAQIFNVDPSYDLLGRKEIGTQIIRTTSNAYFYVENDWWESRSAQEQNDVRIALFELGDEFANKIYPVLTSNFGSEPKPGIDKDERITVLIHQMRPDAGGYFRSGDIYSRLQAADSNEREMIYLNSHHINTSLAKSFLAHEFVHLITANQKDLLRRATEEIWLNEARADYAPTLLGYDNVFQGSNLEMRVKAFLENPNVSLTQWLNKREDYGAANLFSQYLVSQYGVRVLIDSLRSSKIGIASLEEALLKHGIQKNFSQIFSDWVIALLQNDCSLGKIYCYLQESLKDLRIVPAFYFIPKTETILSTYHLSTPWNLTWHRLVGGGYSLLFEFDGDDLAGFEVPYVLCSQENNCSVGFITLDSYQKGTIFFQEFNKKYRSLTIIPFIKSKTEGFNGEEKSFPFFWKVSVIEKTQTETELRNQLLTQISQLQERVRQLQVQLASLLTGQKPPGQVSCQGIENNLYFGIRNNGEISCLQEFLKNQGIDVYPEGLVTGNFLSLTKLAVIRFQEKYASEILMPLGLKSGTGYVGEATRVKINQLLGNI